MFISKDLTYLKKIKATHQTQLCFIFLFLVSTPIPLLGTCGVLLCCYTFSNIWKHREYYHYKPKLISFTLGTQNFSNEGINSCYYSSWALFFLVESNFLAIRDGEREMVISGTKTMSLISAKSASGSLLPAVKPSLFSHTIWTKVASLSVSISELSDPGHETD